MATPADHLAERILALDRDGHDAVRNAWRLHDGTVAARAREVAAGWTAADGVGLPRAGEGGWEAGSEVVAQAALDLLLGACHPEYGVRAAAEVVLPHDVVVTLAQSYREHGWWSRSDRAIVLPRRAGPNGAWFDDATDTPLQYACAAVGDLVAAVDLVRLSEEEEPERDSSLLVGATDCAVAPLVGAEELSIVFENRPEVGDWTYRPELDGAKPTEDVLRAVLEQAVAGGARVLVCPEYSLDAVVLERWRKVLAGFDWEATESRFEWVMVGTGPVEGIDSNVAVLLNRRGKDLLRQTKVRPYDLAPGAWSDGWNCPSYEAEPERLGARELVAAARRWRVLESRAGRVAMAICESVQPAVDDASAVALGQLGPTLVCCPVFSKPTDKSRWERSATEYWGKAGSDVVVANSVVVTEWNGSDGSEVTCAGWRRHRPPAAGKRWESGGVPPRPAGDPLAAVALHPAAA